MAAAPGPARLDGMRRTLAAAVVAACLLTAAAPVVASASPAPSAPVTALPPLDPAALRAAIAGLPDAEASGALVRVRGSAGEWEGTSGVADLRSGRPVPINARFRIGSMTKAFTATAALHLAARGGLDLGDTVQRLVPDLLPVHYPPITVRQLLNHTSGLPGVPIAHKDPAWFLAHRFDTWTPRQLLDLAFRGRGMEFAPGTKQHYGNIGYLVLGVVIEEVAGRPYGEVVREAAIRPLRLTGTSVPGDDTRIHGPHARGYEAVTEGGRTTHVDITEANPTFQWAAAEMISTAADLDRFLVALVSGRLLPPAQTAELFAVPAVPAHDGDDDPTNDVPAHFGGGLARLAVGPVVFWGKTGDRPGYASGMGTTPDLSRRLVFSVNTLRMGGDQPRVAQRVIAAAAGLAA